MLKKSTIWLSIAVVFILPVTAWLLLGWYERKIQALPVYGKTSNHHIDDFTFTNEDGQSISKDNWKGKVIVTNFFFTHCPVICPKMTANLKRVSNEFKNDAWFHITSFTVDPARDSVATLKAYANRFLLNTNNWDLLTGNKAELYKLARNSFMIVATDGDGGPEDFIHSDKLVLIDDQEKIRGYYDGTSEKEVNQLVTDIKKLKHEN